MNLLNNKIDFVVLASATMCNPNGDPLYDNQPRTYFDGHKDYGEMSDVCIKRKIRNRMQDMGHSILIQSADRTDDGFKTINDRMAATITNLDKISDVDDNIKTACETWIDVRSFGHIVTIPKNGKSKGVSIGIRGPVSIHQAITVAPVDIISMQITKSASAIEEGKGSDTMGTKHMVRHGLYLIKGSINVQAAHKNGFTEEDSETLKECLRTLFVNDSTAARPDGSMEVKKLYWWRHNNQIGQYSAADVHGSIQVKLKEGIKTPLSFSDYIVDEKEDIIKRLPGLECEVFSGV